MKVDIFCKKLLLNTFAKCQNVFVLTDIKSTFNIKLYCHSPLFF